MFRHMILSTVCLPLTVKALRFLDTFIHQTPRIGRTDSLQSNAAVCRTVKSQIVGC